MKSLHWKGQTVFFLLVFLASLAGAQIFGVQGGRNGTKGTPFSADRIQETTQVLADGTRIHQETHGKIFRDSQGRTRNENETVHGTSRWVHIMIMDPVSQVLIVLDPQQKTATVNHFNIPQGRTVVPPKPPVAASEAPKPPVFQTEKLDSKEIEGFVAYGTRRTRTVAAGEEGNDRPITVVDEDWFSPDLNTALLTIHDDPRSGQSTTRWTNIQRGDPDPSVFQIPSDYTVKDEPKQQ